MIKRSRARAIRRRPINRAGRRAQAFIRDGQKRPELPGWRALARQLSAQR